VAIAKRKEWCLGAAAARGAARRWFGDLVEVGAMSCIDCGKSPAYKRWLSCRPCLDKEARGNGLTWARIERITAQVLAELDAMDARDAGRRVA
jgi:hypothetical protein